MGLEVMVFNATFNDISAINFIGGVKAIDQVSVVA